MLFASLRTGVSALALLGAAAASAQSTPAETTPTQEVAEEAIPGDIVVTARLRGESLQDVPISIAAFSETAIERMQINSLDRLSFAVPSLSASDPFGRNNPSIAMRGIGLAGIGDELPVGMFIDGVYVAGGRAPTS
jgi:iron complex outermembrane receptor protein